MLYSKRIKKCNKLNPFVLSHQDQRQVGGFVFALSCIYGSSAKKQWGGNLGLLHYLLQFPSSQRFSNKLLFTDSKEILKAAAVHWLDQFFHRKSHYACDAR